MKRFAFLPIIAVAFAVACQDAPTAVQTAVSAPRAALIENERYPIDWYFSSCDGDSLHWLGWNHSTFEQSYNANGKYFYRWHLNSLGTATSIYTGAKYSFSANITQLVIDPPTAGMDTTFNQTWKLIGRGPAANSTVHFLWHLTVNANGEQTADIQKVGWDCK